MRLVPNVKTLAETKQLQRSTQIVKIQFPQFQAHTLNRLVDSMILKTIHERMRDFGYSEKIIDGTKVSGINVISNKRFRIFFRSEYFADSGFDVALAREKGTTRHFIEPISIGSPFFKKPEALHWDDNKFSKGHFVNGIPASHIIERTLDEVAESFLDEYNRAKKAWIEQSFGGLVKVAV